MAYVKKYIITGAPGTGKTTLVDGLTKEYHCMPEVSRSVIISEQERGEAGTPWQDLDKFVALVFDAFQTQLEAHQDALFTDRSPLDLIAYLQLEGKPIPLALDQFPYKAYFRQKVFFAPTWQAIYRQDAQRQQEFAYCEALEKVLWDTYRERGFDILTLPRVPVVDRLHFVKEELKH